MHILFLAPDTHRYNHQFLRALKDLGCTVTSIGFNPRERLSREVRPYLDAYVQVRNVLDPLEMLAAARKIDRAHPVDRVETIDEPMVTPAAQLREGLGIPGVSVRSAELCRDKSAMKDFLRSKGVPCAESQVPKNEADVRSFAERLGYPIIVKPRAGFGSLGTTRVESKAELETLLETMKSRKADSVLLEEFIDGHEGFYDTLTVNGEVAQDFISHYYPGCLAALESREVSPIIAHTNRIDATGYKELRELGARVNKLLDLGTSATHMEWFFGNRGLRFSEIGARPAGEMIWDLYRVANESDIYLNWSRGIIGRPVETKLSRRYATGAIQIRPSQDGRVRAYHGLDDIRSKFGDMIYEYEVPTVGSATLPLEKGWHVNTWFRLRDPDYDRLRSALQEIGQTVKVVAG